MKNKKLSIHHRIKEFLYDPVVKLTMVRNWSDIINGSGSILPKTNNVVAFSESELVREQNLMFSYLTGVDSVNFSQLSAETKAKLLAMLFYHARVSMTGVSLKFKTLDELELNNDVSEHVTPHRILELAPGITPSSPVYFIRDIYPDDEGPYRAGDTMILTDTGLYRWVYTYKSKCSISDKYPKNLRTRKRQIAVRSTFTAMGLLELEKLCSQYPKLPLYLIYSLRQTVENNIGESRRTISLLTDTVERINRVICKLDRNN